MPLGFIYAGNGFTAWASIVIGDKHLLRVAEAAWKRKKAVFSEKGGCGESTNSRAGRLTLTVDGGGAFSQFRVNLE